MSLETSPAEQESAEQFNPRAEIAQLTRISISGIDGHARGGMTTDVPADSVCEEADESNGGIDEDEMLAMMQDSAERCAW